MSDLYKLYQNLGNEKFSEKLCKIVPYFSTISPIFNELRPSYAEVSMANTPVVHNHLGTVHAIAMCNLAEVAAGLMVDVSIPDNCRWIPIGMDVRYLAMARTALKGIANGDGLDFSLLGELAVPVSIYDAECIEVCRAKVLVKISQKKP
jgi:hypothetical protein